MGMEAVDCPAHAGTRRRLGEREKTQRERRLGEREDSEREKTRRERDGGGGHGDGVVREQGSECGNECLKAFECGSDSGFECGSDSKRTRL